MAASDARGGQVTMQICYTSDLHGSATLYDQLADLLRAETPDAVILGGDLFNDGDPRDPVGTQVAYVERDFLKRVALWRELVPRLTVVCALGNHEWVCSRDALRAAHEAGRVVLLDQDRPWRHAGFTLLGYPCTPPTPHWLKDFERLDQAGDALPQAGGFVWDARQGCGREVTPAQHFGQMPTVADELARMPVPPAPWIFVAHAPPHDSKLDRLPHVPYPVGSRAVRRFVEQRQPAIVLHGHVHESAELTGSYTDRLGQALCINPGQRDGQLCAVLFDAARPAETLRHTVYK